MSITGGAPVNTTLRYGHGGFGTVETDQNHTTNCKSSWSTTPGTRRGRICIENTHAPFYSAWAEDDRDYCTSSLAEFYNSNACDNFPVFFSIAVR